jgi:hypothetical protein
MQSFHICISISGALAEYEHNPKAFARSWQGVFSHNDGSPMPVEEVVTEMRAELAQGHKIIPSQGCDHFSWETGCLGHEQEKTL